VRETAAGRHHLWQIDLLRIAPMAGVVIVHSIILTQPADSLGGNALLMVLHTNRELFFFVSAFVLAYSTRAWERSLEVGSFWRRRYPVVLVPYLVWTFIYWSIDVVHYQVGPTLFALDWLRIDLTQGWFDLYFLLVTMQFYLLFPLLAWLLRRARGHHLHLLGISAALQIGVTVVMQYWWPYTPWFVQQWFTYAQVEITSYQFYFLAGALAAIHIDRWLPWLRSHSRHALLLALAGLAVGEGWFWLNLRLSETAIQASNVFQPAELILVGSVLVLLWLLAEHFLARHQLGGRVWSSIRFGADASFGVFLAHMLVLSALVYTPVHTLLGLDGLPAPLVAVITVALTLVTTTALVTALRASPLSWPVLGRARRRGRRASGPERDSHTSLPASPSRARGRSA
jgi:peptidoglycan/LPS O-acetylase OafA/YrhL